MKRSGGYKKKIFADKEELIRLRQKQIRDYNPNLRALADIKLALDDALSNAKLQPHDRNVLVNLLNHRFFSLYKGAKYDGLIAGSAPVPIATPSLAPSVPLPPAAIAPVAHEPMAVEPEVQLLPDVAVETQANQAGVDPAYQHEPTAQERRSMQTPPPLVIPSSDELKITKTYKAKFENVSKEIAKHPHKINLASTGEIILNGKLIPNSSFNDLIRGLFIRNKGSNVHGEDAFVNVLNEIHISPGLISHKIPKNILNSLRNPETKGAESPDEYASVGEDSPEQEEAQEGEGKRAKSKKHSLKIHPPPGKRPRILWLYR